MWQQAQAATSPNMAVVNRDISTLSVSAIVNAANSGLQSGAGVCGAIFKAAGNDGQKLQDACNAHTKGCESGDAKLTSGKFGTLDCDHVIHAVGPDCRVPAQNDRRNQLLTSAYQAAIKSANEARYTSIAFPAISLGIYGFPLNEATKIVVTTVNQSLKTCDILKEVTFCCFGKGSEKVEAA